MYKLLIVDDEPFIADGLYHTFSSLTDPPLDVARTYSAKKALELFTRYRMDIVITDINMPGMNGLDMVREIKDRWPECRVVILSGYDDFDYAQTAIKYGADAYLLKSEGDEALIAAVTDCIRRLEEAAHAREWSRQTAAALEQAEPLLQQEFLSRLTKGELTDGPEIRRRLAALSLPLNPDSPFFLVGGRLDRETCADSMTISTHITAIHVIFRDCLSPKAACTQVLTDHPRYILWLVQSKAQEDDSAFSAFINGTLESIQNYCLYTLKAAVSFLLDVRPVSFSELPAACERMQFFLTHRLTAAEEMVLSDTCFYESVHEAPDAVRLISDINRLHILLGQREADGFQALLSQLLEQMTDCQNPEFQIMLYHNLSALFLNAVFTSHKLHNFLKTFHSCSMFSLPYEKWDIALYETFENIGKWLFEEDNQESERRYRHSLKIIHHYIEEHLNEDITLSALAEQVYLNPVYLSRVYKQITGQNLSHYITEQRIARAKELLRRPEMKINEIGYEVGYESPAHFSRTFKKATGMTPAEYRDGQFGE